MLNIGVKDEYKKVLEKLGFELDDLISEEVDAALGNGGLGRLAACYLGNILVLTIRFTCHPKLCCKHGQVL